MKHGDKVRTQDGRVGVAEKVSVYSFVRFSDGSTDSYASRDLRVIESASRETIADMRARLRTD